MPEILKSVLLYITLCCDHSLESSWKDNSYGRSLHRVWLRNVILSGMFYLQYLIWSSETQTRVQSQTELNLNHMQGFLLNILYVQQCIGADLIWVYTVSRGLASLFPKHTEQRSKLFDNLILFLQNEEENITYYKSMSVMKIIYHTQITKQAKGIKVWSLNLR